MLGWPGQLPARPAWLRRIRAAGGWTRFLSEPRFALVGLRALAAAGRAAKRGTYKLSEELLDFLFPGADQPPEPAAKKKKAEELDAPARPAASVRPRIRPLIREAA